MQSMATDTVEWGSEDRRPSGMPRWTLAAPPRHATAIAGGLAALGFALTLTAEMLPWLEVTPTGDTSTPPDFPRSFDTTLRLTQMVVWQAPAYYIGLTALLALIALTLIGRARARRGAAAAAVGTAAGQVVLLAGLYGSIQDGQITMFGPIPDGIAEFAIGDGFYSAAVGLVLLAGAAALAGWSSGARPTTPAAEAATREPAAVEPEAWADQPADLTVAPATPFRVPPPAGV